MNLQPVIESARSYQNKDVLLGVVNALERQHYDVVVANHYHGSKELDHPETELELLYSHHEVSLALRRGTNVENLRLFIFLPESDLFERDNAWDFAFRFKNLHFDSLNPDSLSPDIWIPHVLSQGHRPEVVKVSPTALHQNLMMLDSSLPQILGWMLLYSYGNDSKKDCFSLLKKLKAENPLAFDLAFGHPFYEYKLKRFLIACATKNLLGEIWSDNVTSANIVLMCQNQGIEIFDVYQYQELADYLIRHTLLSGSNAANMSPDSVYFDDSSLYLNLGLRLRCYSQT